MRTMAADISLPALLMVLCLGSTVALADDHGVILLYHHVSEQTPVSTSVTPDVFQSHLTLLRDGGYHVISLPDMIAALASGEPLPARSVALTFDDAYLSVATEAAPRLQQLGWPFTLFVTTDYIDRPGHVYMTWDQLRNLERQGATIGNHSRSHAHFAQHLPGEDMAGWRSRITNDIQTAQTRLRQELNRPAQILAYPYGEYDDATEALAAELGYVAVGQHSGPVGYATPRTALPRFPVAARFADLPTLTEKLASRPLPVTVLSPQSRVLKPGAPAPELRLRIAPGDYRTEQLNCFVSGQSSPQVRWRDRDAGEVSVEAVHPLPTGRSKYTCTAPSATEPGVYYWFTYLWMTPNQDGSWYRD